MRVFIGLFLLIGLLATCSANDIETKALKDVASSFVEVANTKVKNMPVMYGKNPGNPVNKQEKFNGQLYEDCMGCRFVWKQVEQDVGNARYVEDVQASFEHNCLDAQKANIFFKVCEDMYDDMYAMTDDYMSGDFTVDQICIRARVCTPVAE